MSTILLRGIVGSGKTAVRDRLAEMVDAFALGADIVRTKLPWSNKFVHGVYMSEDEVEKNRQFVYGVLRACVAANNADAARRLQAAKYHDALSFEQERQLDDFFYSVRTAQQRNIICEAPFHPIHHLRTFYDVPQDQPVLIEVEAEKETILQRLPQRKSDETQADISTYEGMLRTWQPVRGSAFHAHYIENNACFETLHKQVKDTMDVIRRCPDCPRNI